MKHKLIAIVGVVLMLFIMAIPSAQAAPNTGRGFTLNNSGYDGLRAVMSTMVGTGSPPSFNFAVKSPDVFQYFATQMRPNNSCLSADVIHKRNVGGSTTHHLTFGVWCNNGTLSGTFDFDLTNSTFRTNYVRTLTYNDTGTSFQDEVVDVRIYQTNAGINQWGAYIYNYTTSTYDWKAYFSGTLLGTGGFIDVGDGGYTQDATMSCPTLYPWGIMEVRGVQKRSGGTWNWIGSSDVTSTIADSWPCLSTNTWEQKSSLYHQVKIVPYGAAY